MKITQQIIDDVKSELEVTTETGSRFQRAIEIISKSSEYFFSRPTTDLGYCLRKCDEKDPRSRFNKFEKFNMPKHSSSNFRYHTFLMYNVQEEEK